MEKKTKNRVKIFIALALGTAAFIFISQLSQKYNEELKYIVDMGGIWGMLAYVFLIFLAIVIAPLGMGFLLPVASNVWGPFVTGTLSIIGWILGAVVAFFLARKYGRPLVEKFFSKEQLEKVEKLLPESYTFLTMVFLRIALPVDILSYILGLFRFIKFRTYFFATLIGISPFSYIFAYSAVLPLELQIAIGVLGTVVLVWGVYFLKKHYFKK